MMKKALVAVTTAAVLLSIGFGALRPNAARSKPHNPNNSMAVRALQLSQVIANHEISILHAVNWETDSRLRELKMDLFDNLLSQSNLDVRWKARCWPAGVKEPNPPPPDTFDADGEFQRPNPFELRAFSELRKASTQQKEILSDDNRHYVRIFRNTQSCNGCHKGDIGTPLGFVSLELNFDS